MPASLCGGRGPARRTGVAALRPRHGRIGLVALPYHVAFELLAPFVELAALVLVPLGVGAGAVDVGFAWRWPCGRSPGR